MPSMQRISKGNTKVREEGNDTVVTLYNTVVVRFNGMCVTLNSGGYRTATTKCRMNQASNQFDLGYSVYQKDGDWFVSWRGQVLHFADGMKLMRGC